MSITGSAKAVRRFLLRPTQGPATILLIRLAVGLIFSTQGILKYIDPNMGVVRFTRIGFAHPYFTAHFVGTFEIAKFALQGLVLRIRILRRTLWGPSRSRVAF